MERRSLPEAGILPAALVFLILAGIVFPSSAVPATVIAGNNTIAATGPAANQSASPGTRQSVTGTEDWVAGLSGSLSACYRDMLETFGFGSTNYPSEVSRSLEKGLNLTRNITLIP